MTLIDKVKNAKRNSKTTRHLSVSDGDGVGDARLRNIASESHADGRVSLVVLPVACRANCAMCMAREATDTGTAHRHSGTAHTMVVHRIYTGPQTVD